jgi:hypothetical protein
VYGFLGGEFLAVVAAEFEVFLVDYIKLGGHCLGVGNALGVGAFDEVLDVVGYLGGEFFFHLILFYGDDGNKGRDKCYFADIFLGEVLVFDFDDAFATEFATLEVVADEHLVFVFFKTEDVYDLINQFGGDMVDDGAVLDGGHYEFFLGFHDDVDMLIS